MTLWEWLGLGVAVGLCLWAYFGTRGSEKRCQKIEGRIKRAVKQLNKELDEK